MLAPVTGAQTRVKQLYVRLQASADPGDISQAILALESNMAEVLVAGKKQSAEKRYRVTVLCAVTMREDLASVDLELVCSQTCGFLLGTWSGLTISL